MPRLAYLDALRGVAVLMVVLVHVGLELRPYGLPTVAPVRILTEYGQMGVQLFFVVSAFSLCVAHERRAADPHRLRTFFIQRFFRIAPLYYVGILAALLLGMLQNADRGAARLIPDVFTVSGVLSNVFFIHGFVVSAIAVVRGGWSMGTEMAFYLCFPLAFRLVAWVGRQGLRPLAVAWAGCFTATLAFYYWQTDGFLVAVLNSRFLYFNLANQLPVFMAGLVAYFVRREGWWRPTRPVALAGFAVLTAAAMALEQSSLNYAFVLLPSVSGLAFVLLVEGFAQWPALSAGWLQQLGRLSFSIYLFHSAVVYLVVRHLFAAPVWNDWLVSRQVLVFVLTTGITVFVSTVTERWIERPGIALGHRLAARLAGSGGKVP
jgi:peptidoglycan/LPS O-acetylase OafA/YrhL